MRRTEAPAVARTRSLVRNILHYNAFNRTLAANLAATDRVSAGTVFFLGYDDRYQQDRRLDAALVSTNACWPTNRAFFTKFSYLFRF